MNSNDKKRVTYERRRAFVLSTMRKIDQGEITTRYLGPDASRPNVDRFIASNDVGFSVFNDAGSWDYLHSVTVGGRTYQRERGPGEPGLPDWIRDFRPSRQHVYLRWGWPHVTVAR